MALLVPSLRGVWMRYNMTRCQSNLFHIYQAFRLRASDEVMGVKEAYAVATWTTALMPYLENDTSQFFCTETTVGDAVASQPIWDLVEFRTVNPDGTFYTRLEPGTYMLKLSDTQWNTARSEGLLGNADSANHIRTNPDHPEFNTYVPDGNSYVYWLCMEDRDPDGDFKDVMTRVTDNRDGTTTVECISGYTGYTNHLMDKATGEPIFATLSDQWNFSPDRTITLGGVAMDASYGMNEYAVDKVALDGELTRRGIGGAGGKVLVMDYPKLEAKTTDLWAGEAWDPDGDGVPVFARHFGMANVLFSDGSVRPMRVDTINPPPEDINPFEPTAAMKWWMP
jgi:prepilin-type processing-associated H-X9-DG protein